MVLSEGCTGEYEEADIEIAVLSEERFKKPLVIHASDFFRDVQSDTVLLHEGNLRIRFTPEPGETGVNSNLVTNPLEEGKIDRRKHDAGNARSGVNMPTTSVAPCAASVTVSVASCAILFLLGFFQFV